jgi:hypothetical protein
VLGDGGGESRLKLDEDMSTFGQVRDLVCDSRLMIFGWAVGSAYTRVGLSTMGFPECPDDLQGKLDFEVWNVPLGLSW